MKDFRDFMKYIVNKYCYQYLSKTKKLNESGMDVCRLDCNEDIEKLFLETVEYAIKNNFIIEHDKNKYEDLICLIRRNGGVNTDQIFYNQSNGFVRLTSVNMGLFTPIYNYEIVNITYNIQKLLTSLSDEQKCYFVLSGATI